MGSLAGEGPWVPSTVGSLKCCVSAVEEFLIFLMSSRVAKHNKELQTAGLDYFFALFKPVGSGLQSDLLSTWMSLQLSTSGGSRSTQRVRLRRPPPNQTQAELGDEKYTSLVWGKIWDGVRRRSLVCQTEGDRCDTFFVWSLETTKKSPMGPYCPEAVWFFCSFFMLHPLFYALRINSKGPGLLEL